MDTTTSFGGRVSAARPVLWFAVLLGLVLAVMGAAILTGVLRSPAPITGLATNGRILVADGGSLRTLAADGTDSKVLLALPVGASNLSISPDGRRVAYGLATDTGGIEIASLDGGDPIAIPLPAGVAGGDQISWSPSGDQIVFPGFTGTNEAVYVAPADGSASATALVPDRTLGREVWWPAFSPDGMWISFLAKDKVAPKDKNPGTDNTTDPGDLSVVHPDGTGYQRLATAPAWVGENGGGIWSPDPKVQRILYVAASNVIRMVDVASGKDQVLFDGFWPTWSPDGSKIAFWGSGGTRVISTVDALTGVDRSKPVVPRFDGSCSAANVAAGTAFCGPVHWSPDGTRLIGPDLSGRYLLSVKADGSGAPITVPLDTTDAVRPKGAVAWQPIRP